MRTLILLRDFDHWFQQLPLRLPGVSSCNEISYFLEAAFKPVTRADANECALVIPLRPLSRQALEPLRDQLIEALRAITDVRTQDLVDLRRMTEARRGRDEFLLTLDGGTYFRNADYSFAMTRAVTRLRDAERGRMIRVAREGYGQFWTQVSILRREFEASGKSSIVLADDGIDTGRSLAEVVRQLNEQYLEVSSIRVLLNPNGLPRVEGVKVDSISPDRDMLWTHERDLFWGSPTGGVSLITRDNVNQLGGIPYSLNCALLRRRLGTESASRASLAGVRCKLLDINMEFWVSLTRAAGRPLRLRDCKRLMWATELEDFTAQSLIVDVIAWLRDNEPKL